MKIGKNDRSEEEMRKNNGFTLVELIVTVAIMTVLIGFVAPSINSLLGFEAQKATGRVTAALDNTRVQAMNRLVGEMKLEYKEGEGYYITEYLDLGKESRTGSYEQQAEKVASSKVRIRYKVSDKANPIDMKEEPSKSLILTYSRETGGFRPIQTSVMVPDEVSEALQKNEDIQFHDGTGYCEWIQIQCGLRTRTIYLKQETGGYEVKAN